LLLDPVSLAIVAALGIVAAVVGGVGGFGTGIILTAALAPLIGVKQVIPVLAVAGAIINGGRFWFYRHSFDRRALTLVLACALPFLVLGTWIYSILDVRVLGTLLGIVVIGSVPLRRILQRRKVVLNSRSLAVGSGVFGLATGIATGTGVIMVTLLLGTGMSGTVNVVAGQPASASVSIMNNFFSPSSVSIAPGGTVTWTNNGTTHTVTSP